jgi:hypothetical protein
MGNMTKWSGQAYKGTERAYIRTFYPYKMYKLQGS